MCIRAVSYTHLDVYKRQVQTLTEQNLALIGRRESITNDPNPGNFLALLKYLDTFVTYKNIFCV